MCSIIDLELRRDIRLAETQVLLDIVKATKAEGIKNENTEAVQRELKRRGLCGENIL